MVISGQLVTEMVPENGVRPIRNTLGPFEMTPFYQGSVHHQFNPRCEDAVFVAAFASEDFGTGQVLNEIFELNQDAIVDTFGGSFNGDMIEAIRDKLPESVVLGVETCLRECGGQKDGGSVEGEGVSGDIGNDAAGEVGGEAGAEEGVDIGGEAQGGGAAEVETGVEEDEGEQEGTVAVGAEGEEVEGGVTEVEAEQEENVTVGVEGEDIGAVEGGEVEGGDTEIEVEQEENVTVGGEGDETEQVAEE